ncbi:MAG: DoxX family protein [Planctomycetes bacterium]|nr:DoxX family protein [Planctomycetota bacterium]
MADERGLLHKVFSRDMAALVLRIVLGLIFVFHGGQKMFGCFNFDELSGWLQWFDSPRGPGGFTNTVKGFVSMGVPRPLAMAVPITEFFGGLCLLFGLLSRFWAAGLAIIMANAIIMVHGRQGWANNEFQLSLLAMSLAVFLAGPGRWALADWEGRLLGLTRGDD